MRFHHRKSSRWKTRAGFFKCFCRFLSDLFPLGYLDGSVSYSLCHLQSVLEFQIKKILSPFSVIIIKIIALHLSDGGVVASPPEPPTMNIYCLLTFFRGYFLVMEGKHCVD